MPDTTTSTRTKAGATKTADIPATIRDEVLASVKQAQQLTLDAVNTWVDIVGKVVPELPTLPFVPARAEIVDGLGTAFELAEELLTTQRKFTSDLVNALVPAV